MRYRITLLIALITLVATVSKAQDIHYSQFYASPLTLNPALTGKFNGEYRIGGIYRNQWRAIEKPLFATPSISADFSLFKGSLEKSALGLGVVLLNDKAGALSTLQGGLSAAWHQGFGAKGNTQISLGIQGNYVQKSFDQEGLIFPDQIQNDLTIIPTSTDIVNDKISYIDLNAGLLFNTKFASWGTFYAGFSYMHLLPRDETFVEGATSENNLPARQVIHGGFEFEAGDRWLIIPGALYQTQAQAQEINFGSTFGYKLLDANQENTATFFLGAWHRLDESVIAKAGLEWSNIRVGAAYDITVSELAQDGQNALGKTPNAFEIYLIYIGNIFQPREDIYLFNPRY